MAVAAMQGADRSSGELNHSHTLTHRRRSHREQSGVKYLAQGYIDMQHGGAGNRPPTGGRLLYL